jgi:hypothetical protein
MAENKYDFIKELLANKKLSHEKRERILDLASKEIGLGGTIEERIRKLEEKVNGSPNPIDLLLGGAKRVSIESFLPEQNINNETKEEKMDGVESEIKNKSLPKYISPSQLYKFLFEYNQNPILRSTCHDIDANELIGICDYCNTKIYDFNKHLAKIIESYNKHEKKYFAPFQVKALIRGYLTGKKYNNEPLESWSSNQIKINWSSNELLAWATKNPGVAPSSSSILFQEKKIDRFEINPQVKSPVTYKPVQNFTQLVLHFKNLFHLKSGHQSLIKIINRINLIKKWDEQLDIHFSEDFSKNLEHFTAVDTLIQSYNILINLIVEQQVTDQKPEVVLSFYENDSKVFFSIHHTNNVYNKTIQNTKERLGQTYRNLIKNQINGLCNLYLKADFGNDNYAMINLWNGVERGDTKINKFKGVEHLLEFSKK